MKDWIVEVIQKTAAFDPADPTTMDISPGAFGHNTLGANDGKGWPKNPVTGEPYPPQVVRRGDFARVMAEFWADGPKSETPPGHWNMIANVVADSPAFKRQLFGKGAPLDPLSWDVHVYLALNGAVHDAAIAAWGIKRQTATVRRISLVRWMGGKGQSSDPKGPSYDPDGLPIVPGLIEVITKESSAPGQRHEHLAFFVGSDRGARLARRAGRSREPSRGRRLDPRHRLDHVPAAHVRDAGVPRLHLGSQHVQPRRRRGARELTGSPYFPGGLAEYVAPKDTFLTFENGPSKEVRLQWATYFDASDQAGQSRIWGSIHIPPDDFAGRRLGHQLGLDAVALATKYFDGKP